MEPLNLILAQRAQGCGTRLTGQAPQTRKVRAHICAGSSGSGSRIGLSGFSGESGGSLIGGGEGSGGLRTRRKPGRNVSNCEETVMALRCKKLANGSRRARRGPLYTRAVVNTTQRFPIAVVGLKPHLSERKKTRQMPGKAWTVEDEQCQRIGGRHEAGNFRFLLFL